MTQTVILIVKQDEFTMYNRFSWETYHSLPLWKKIYYWLDDYLSFQKYPFHTIETVAKDFPALKAVVPSLHETFENYPHARIRLTFTRG